MRTLAADKAGTLTEGCSRLHRMVVADIGGEAMRTREGSNLVRGDASRRTPDRREI